MRVSYRGSGKLSHDGPIKRGDPCPEEGEKNAQQVRRSFLTDSVTPWAPIRARRTVGVFRSLLCLNSSSSRYTGGAPSRRDDRGPRKSGGIATDLCFERRDVRKKSGLHIDSFEDLVVGERY